MTPAEKITAAIQRLEQLKADSTQGEWQITEELWDGAGRWDIYSYTKTGEYVSAVTADGDGIGSLQNRVNAELICTLHRTIDAQLAILHSAFADIVRWVDPDSEYGWEPQDGPAPTSPAFEAKLALANAILGEL